MGARVCPGGDGTYGIELALTSLAQPGVQFGGSAPAHGFMMEYPFDTTRAARSDGRGNQPRRHPQPDVPLRPTLAIMPVDLFYICSHTRTMHDARAIANFFLNRADARKMNLSIMTLLKVLYFAHAWYLAKEGKPLIAQPFEAWDYGPVSRVVYDQFKSFGKNPINARALSFDTNKACFSAASCILNAETEKFLNDIFDYYTQFHALKLSDLTHEKGSPWDVVWSAAATRAVPGMYIPNDLIAAWFKRRPGVYGT